MSRNRLYTLLAIACTAGYAWLGFSLQAQQHSFSVCLFKAATGVPCPSCGTTRSVMALLQTDLKEALYLNPLGFLASLLLLIIPVWVVTDLLRRSSSLWVAYQKMELLFRKKPIAFAAILLIVTNWIWNISKGL